ncbi:MAG: N-acetyltransferase family protein [Bacteroidetes bacterium]|nr:MAG: N-acetyltransferase family protein [Bacteroidota bacterium]
MVRAMQQEDSSRVLEIYRMGLERGNSTFETEVPSWKEWDSKHLTHSKYIFEDNGIILGWVALSPFSERKVYKGMAEVSIYVDTDFHGKKIGSCLMEQMIASSELNGIWTLFSSVFPENEATIKLHQKFGFRIIGKRERIAKLHGKWRDTILLERRSSKFT